MHIDSTKTTPLGLARYAHDYFDAARAVHEQAEAYEIVSPMPALYLIGRSIELALKAYLLKHGIPLCDFPTKKYGHNLHACQRKANELGLLKLVDFDKKEAGAVELLNNLYFAKQLEYIVTGTKYIPIFELVESFARKLIRAVATEVEYVEFNR